VSSGEIIGDVKSDAPFARKSPVPKEIQDYGDDDDTDAINLKNNNTSIKERETGQ
jgi:hypothetical protein